MDKKSVRRLDKVITYIMVAGKKVGGSTHALTHFVFLWVAVCCSTVGQVWSALEWNLCLVGEGRSKVVICGWRAIT